MAHARRRPAAPVAMSARKSAPVSAGGVNVRRLMLSREMAAEASMIDEEKELVEESNHECGSPFCRQVLSNRYARFCEDNPICQRYRALKLQCLANAQGKDDEAVSNSMALGYIEVGEKRKKEELFVSNGKTELLATVEKRKRYLSEESTHSNSSPRQKETLVKKCREGEEKDQSNRKKRLKRNASERKDTEAVAGSTRTRSPSVVSSASSVDSAIASESLETKRLNLRSMQTRQAAKTRNDVEDGKTVTTVKKRRLVRPVRTDESRSPLSPPILTVSDVSEAAWTIPRANPARLKTAAQAIKNMTVDLVPLGVGNQAGVAGGGRYVQNGNRSATQSLDTAGTRAKAPHLTKFALPAVALPAVAPSSVLLKRTQRPQPSVELPTVPHSQLQLPPLHIQPLLNLPTVSRQARFAFKEKPAAIVDSNTSAELHKRMVRTRGMRRISTADYLRRRNSDTQPQEGLQSCRPSRSPSLERFTDFPPASTHGLEIFEHRVRDSPHVLNIPEFRGRDGISSSNRSSRSIEDSRWPYLEGNARLQRPSYDSKSRDRRDGQGDFVVSDQNKAVPWKARSVSPRVKYPLWPQDSSFFKDGSSGNNHSLEMSYSTSPPLVTQTAYRKDHSREQPKPIRRSESPRHRDFKHSPGKQSDLIDDLWDKDLPTFSYHEAFLPRLLYVFIHVLPQSLAAIMNVTKKPRKMNWYLKYVERIERLCKSFDLQIKVEGLKAIVNVQGREWFMLESTSTVILHLEIIKTLRAEALSWRRLYEEMEQSLTHYQEKVGEETNQSFVFVRAWNELKSKRNYLSVPRQTNFFCGARLHHWNFVVGKVEIGSGSFEEKREAFRLATTSALEFLLNCGRGLERPSRKVSRNWSHALKEEPMSRKSYQSSSRESSTSAVRATDQENVPLLDSALSAGRPSTQERTTKTISTRALVPKKKRSDLEESSAQVPSVSQPHRLVEPSSSPVAIIPVTDCITSQNNLDLGGKVELDVGNRSTASDLAMLSTRAPSRPSNENLNASEILFKSTPPVLLAVPTLSNVSAQSVETKKLVTPSLTSTASRGDSVSTPKIVSLTASLSGSRVDNAGQSIEKNDLTSRPKIVLSPRWCMMCEMIRLRKPDGERCLRCQKNGNSANVMLDAVLGP
ncbi:hypothetical protein CCR75_009782 [Bremia lactucae]|uniref:Uncharacterized protein n=1 Tax=Bremia lactucae TaxID=4779 RepID=A0A976FJG2_BRELC|nr:hypothetical protein CCR75_009782 [Bremia lactucae]